MGSEAWGPASSAAQVRYYSEDDAEGAIKDLDGAPRAGPSRLLAQNFGGWLGVYARFPGRGWEVGNIMNTDAFSMKL